MSTADSSDVVGSVGGTPLVELRRVVPAGNARVLVKVESQNPTGSMKDRMALSVVDRAASSVSFRRACLEPICLTIASMVGGARRDASLGIGSDSTLSTASGRTRRGQSTGGRPVHRQGLPAASDRSAQAASSISG